MTNYQGATISARVLHAVFPPPEFSDDSRDGLGSARQPQAHTSRRVQCWSVPRSPLALASLVRSLVVSSGGSLVRRGRRRSPPSCTSPASREWTAMRTATRRAHAKRANKAHILGATQRARWHRSWQRVASLELAALRSIWISSGNRTHELTWLAGRSTRSPSA